MNKNLLLLTYFILTSIFITKTDGIVTSIYNKSTSPADVEASRPATLSDGGRGLDELSDQNRRIKQRIIVTPKKSEPTLWKFGGDKYDLLSVQTVQPDPQIFNAQDIQNRVILNIDAHGIATLQPTPAN
jgi:hypothetical protein